jgi:hypothetical protein
MSLIGSSVFASRCSAVSVFPFVAAWRDLPRHLQGCENQQTQTADPMMVAAHADKMNIASSPRAY